MMDWGVPDWRDATGYPSTDSALSLEQWCWEFTRRRPDYRALWQRLWPELQNFVEVNAEWCRALADDERALNSEVETRWAKVHLQPYLHELRTCYRLNGLPDPRIGDRDDDQLRHLLYLEDRHCAVEYHTLDAVMMDQAAGYLLYRFDPKRPAPKQLEDAGAYLRDMQKAAHGGKKVHWKPESKNWPLYLRALDAHDADASPDDMASVFWPLLSEPRPARKDGIETKPVKRAKHTHEQACALRDFFKI